MATPLGVLVAGLFLGLMPVWLTIAASAALCGILVLAQLFDATLHKLDGPPASVLSRYAETRDREKSSSIR